MVEEVGVVLVVVVVEERYPLLEGEGVESICGLWDSVEWCFVVLVD